MVGPLEVDEPREWTARSVLGGAACAAALAALVSSLATRDVVLVLAIPVAAFAGLARASSGLERNLAQTIAASAVVVAVVAGLHPKPTVGAAAIALAVAWVAVLRRGLMEGEADATGRFPDAVVREFAIDGRASRASLLIGVATGAIGSVLVDIGSSSSSASSASSSSSLASGILAGDPLWIGLGALVGAVTAGWVLIGALLVSALAFVTSAAAGPPLAVAALLAASATRVVRHAPRLWRAATHRAPQRVRFEIGGAGTRVEDMTPRVDRDMSREAALLIFVVAIVALSPAVGFLAALSLAAWIGVAVMIASAVAASLGTTVAPFWIVITATALSRSSSPAPWLWGALAVAAAVATALATDLKAGLRLQATPRRLQWGALFGGWIGVAVVSFVRDGSSTSLIADGATPAAIGAAAAVGVVVEAVAATGVPQAIGGLLPAGAVVALLVGGILRSIAERRGAPAIDRLVALAAGWIAGDALSTVVRATLDSSGIWSRLHVAGWLLALGSMVLLLLTCALVLRSQQPEVDDER